MNNSLSNKELTVLISSENGSLKELIIRRNNFGRWNGYPGYLTVEDELTGRKYRDTKNELTLRQKRCRENGAETIENQKEFQDADFIVEETWKAGKDCLSWRVAISLKENQPARTIRIKQLFPYPDNPYGLGVWSAQYSFPSRVEKVAGLRLHYGDLCFGTAIPAFTLYRKKDDIGLTVCKPLGLKTSSLSFSFQDYYSQGVEIETDLLGLRPGKPAVVEFLIHVHEGCWRPGLNWIYQKYPAYFNPPNKKVREIEGGFMISNPFTTEKTVTALAPFGVKWEELHNHFPYYGEYAPKEKSWKSVVSIDYPHLPELPEITPRAISKHLKMVHKHGVKSLMYFQCAGDGYLPVVTKKFPGSIIRKPNGSFIPIWIKCCLMNTDPATPFGRERMKMIDRFLKQYPEIDGVFLDNMNFDGIDAAHDDGITMYENKPAYSIRHCYEKPVRKLAGKLHRSGKLIFANGPCNVEVQKEIDGHMSEGIIWISDTLKYLCIAKPMLTHTYPREARLAEKMFFTALLCGASYSVGASSSLAEPAPITGDIKKVFETYIPLVKHLYGRKWLLEPNPLLFPGASDGDIVTGSNGEIFRGEKGEIIITLVSRQKSILDQGGISKNLKLSVRFKGTAEIKAGWSYGTHYSGRKKVKIVKNNERLELMVAEHSAATVIILK